MLKESLPNFPTRLPSQTQDFHFYIVHWEYLSPHFDSNFILFFSAFALLQTNLIQWNGKKKIQIKTRTWYPIFLEVWNRKGATFPPCVSPSGLWLESQENSFHIDACFFSHYNSLLDTLLQYQFYDRRQAYNLFSF